MSRKLTPDQAKNLLRQDEHGPGKRYRPPLWPSIQDRRLLHAAAIAKKPTVTFANGREFKLRYATRKSIAWNNYEAVFVTPADGAFTPCGWYRIKSLLALEV